MSSDGQSEITDFYSLRKGSKVKANPNYQDITSKNKLEGQSNFSVSNFPSSSKNLNLNPNPEEITSDNSNPNREKIASDSDSESNSVDLNNTFLNYSENSDSNISIVDSKKQGEIRNSKMAKKDFNMFQAVKFISEFDGTPSKLHQFLECSDLIFDDLKDSEHNKFLLVMKKLLVGKAYDETVKHIVYDSWDDLKEDLKRRYTEVRSKLQVSQELNTVRQKKDEDVRSYGSRVQVLLSQFNDICITEAGTGSEKFVESINSHTALIAFQEGLNSNIRVIVKASNSKTLNESIAKAIEEEALSKRHVNYGEYSSNIVKCQICKKQGHSADRCYQFRPKNNLQDHQSSRSKIPTIGSVNTNSSGGSGNNNKNNIVCAYCKKHGHHIDNCYTLKNKDKKNSQSNEAPKNSSDNSKKLTVISSSNNNSANNVSGNESGLDQSIPNRAVRARDL